MSIYSAFKDFKIYLELLFEEKKFKFIPIGKDDFKKLIENEKYFVDKSLFIDDIIDSGSEVLLFTRPRRFGKSLNLSMLKYFFDIKESTRKLFFRLKIKKKPNFNKHLNSYPVIFLNFKDVKFDNYEDSYENIKTLIADEFKKYGDISDKLSEKDKFISYMNEEKLSLVAWSGAIHFLSKALSEYYNKKVIILIDEYDTPIHQAYTHKYYNEMLNFIRPLFSMALKSNIFLEKAVMTGILRIGKESIFSGLNNLDVYTLDKSLFSNFFGFEENEVKELLEYYSMSEHYDLIKKWYNGYVFGESTIYNPWSIINFIKDNMKNKNVIAESYWTKTASIDFIKDMVINSSREIQKELKYLMMGESVKSKLIKNISFGDLKNQSVNRELIYSFLAHSGYLNVRYIDNQNYEFFIPNLEIESEFKNLIEIWLRDVYQSDNLQALLHSLINWDIEEFKTLLQNIVLNLSSHDIARNSEAVYHSFLLALLLNLDKNYKITSNKESGYGRYDIVLTPRNKNKFAIIIELKYISKDLITQEEIDEALEDAIKQIEDKKYDIEIKKDEIYDIKKLAILFHKKEVYIKAMAVSF